MAALTISKEEEQRLKGLGFLNNKGTDNFSARVITVNGKVTVAQHRCLADAAEKFGNGNLTFTTRLTVEVQGIPYENIEAFREFIAKEGLTTGGTGSKVRPIVSCKGTTCQNDLGIIGQRIPEFHKELCKGCKKCAIEAACPIGASKVIDGVLVRDEEKCNHCGRCIGHCRFDSIVDGQYGFKIYIGGRWGKQVSQGRALGKIFTSKDGFENVEKQLLSDEILDRKEEILTAELKTK